VDGSLPLRDKLLGDALDLIIAPDAFTDSRLAAQPVGQVESAWMCRPGLVPAPAKGRPVRLHDLAAHRMLVQGNASGTGRLYDAWLRERGVEPTDTLVVSNLIALAGLTVSGLGVSYLPRHCLAPLVAAGMLSEIDVQPPLPPVPYVAMVRADQRSALVASVTMLAQSCCDFSRVFQVGVEAASSA